MRHLNPTLGVPWPLKGYVPWPSWFVAVDGQVHELWISTVHWTILIQFDWYCELTSMGKQHKPPPGHHPTLPRTTPNLHLAQEHIAAQKDIGLRKFGQELLVARAVLKE